MWIVCFNFKTHVPRKSEWSAFPNLGPISDKIFTLQWPNTHVLTCVRYCKSGNGASEGFLLKISHHSLCLSVCLSFSLLMHLWPCVGGGKENLTSYVRGAAVPQLQRNCHVGPVFLNLTIFEVKIGNLSFYENFIFKKNIGN